MKRILGISDSLSVAVHGLLCLGLDPSAVQSVNGVAATTGLSRDHLSKMFQRLSRAGMVRSIRGPGGGFQLVTRPAHIRLIDVYEAIEGPFPCANGRKCDNDCSFPACPFGRIVDRVINEVKDYLISTTLADLIEQYQVVSEGSAGEP